MTRKSIYLTIGAALSLCSHTYAQESADAEGNQGFRKNAILATMGTVGLMGAYNLSFERMLLASKEGSIQGLWTKAGVGGWGVWSTGGPYQSLMLGTMTGKRNSHLELNGGLARMFNKTGYDHAEDMSTYFSEPQPLKSDYIHIRIVGAVGYRFQKPTSRFLFRSGVGYPETLYLGIGAAF
ncbi:hypothetical protein [Pontibacter virosus]|uniref:Outer membrane protein with beta-barrel domain n=1 Tax=Pontibacter virosus TaxID=1765052 RepID=A0A2U1AZM3_9BACT|nr:hypothetical protein [Pontibacter virosus]PVY41781.1 hypothetical protein C8E01_104152 [Pontibacter virosus]